MTSYRDAVMALREREARVFGVSATPEHKRPRTMPSPFPLVHTAPRPVLVEHATDCTSDRVETVPWSGGIHTSRCIDCGAHAEARS